MLYHYIEKNYRKIGVEDVMLIHFLFKTATKRYGVFIQRHGYNYFYLILYEKKTIKKWDTQFESEKKNCITFQI